MAIGRSLLLLSLLPLCVSVHTSCSKGSTPSAPSGRQGEWSSNAPQPDDAWFSVSRIPVSLPPGTEAEIDMSRNFYIIFDGSGSMAERVDQRCGATERFKRKIDGARWALTEFIEAVPDNANLGLFVFDRRGAREVLPLERLNRPLFLKQISEISVGGTTPLASSIRYASDRLNEQYIRQLGYGEYRLIVITDGLAESIPKAALYAAQRGVPIYAIGLCVEADHPLRHYSLSYQGVDNFSDLRRHLDATLAELPAFDPGDFSSLETETQ